MRKYRQRVRGGQIQVKPGARGHPTLFERPFIFAELEAITQESAIETASHERRRNDSLHTPLSLQQYTNAFNTRNDSSLETMGKPKGISKSFVYLHMQPTNKNTIHGRRHYADAKLKSLLPRANYHVFHMDTHFARAQIYALESLARKLGDKMGTISIDEKATIPLELPAISKTTRMFMASASPVIVHDHTFSIGKKQSLVPSVICGANYDFKINGKIGPMVITIRSSKHNGASPITRFVDILKAQTTPTLKQYFHTTHNKPKSVICIMSDGSTEGNQRFFLCQIVYTLVFFVLGCTYLFIAHNAPGRSAFNLVERAMSFLNRPLVGIELPGFTHGVHLVNKMVPPSNEDLEKRNFAEAIEVLKKLWKSVCVNSHTATVHTVEPGLNEATTFLQKVVQYKEGPAKLSEKDRLEVEQFIAKMYRHSSFSQYFGQIRKCTNPNCCREVDSEVVALFKNYDGWFPTPVPISEQNDKWHSFDALLLRNWVTPDTHCPSSTAHVCGKCGLISTSKEGASRHNKFFHNTNFLNKLQQNKTTKILADSEPIDKEEEDSYKKEQQALRVDMGFDAKGSLSRQIEALQIAGVIHSGTPRLRRHSKRVTLTDGVLVKSYTTNNLHELE